MINARPLTFFCSMLLLQACGLFKNHSQSTSSNQTKMENFTDLQLSAQSHSSAESQRILLTDDSLGYDYSLEIWPKGIFSFSQEKGFIGEANKVLLSGTGSHISMMQLQQNEELQVATANNSGLTQAVSETTSLDEAEKASTPSWKWVIVLGLVLLVVIACVLVFFARLSGLRPN
ncbi:hypothetical protein [Pedobacter immunditicola]|uniref:hypothetical protein n=1 Tax=Pedobacter immunditicola TaxID=3133440 RepID=UPI003096D71F